jgi:asparagine synthetase B (glutamine-hydrolysing)
MKNQALANNTGNALAFVNFTDVNDGRMLMDRTGLIFFDPDEFKKMEPAPSTAVTFETFAGLVIDLRIQIGAGDDAQRITRVKAVASGEGADEINARYEGFAFSLPDGAIEAMTRKPSELIENPATDEIAPATNDTPGLPPPTDD